jgi:hypothetical protein
MVARDIEEINQDKEYLRKSYEMTDFGDLSWFLGMHVTVLGTVPRGGSPSLRRNTSLRDSGRVAAGQW